MLFRERSYDLPLRRLDRVEPFGKKKTAAGRESHSPGSLVDGVPLPLHPPTRDHAPQHLLQSALIDTCGLDYLSLRGARTLGQCYQERYLLACDVVTDVASKDFIRALMIAAQQMPRRI